MKQTYNSNKSKDNPEFHKKSYYNGKSSYGYKKQDTGMTSKTKQVEKKFRPKSSTFKSNFKSSEKKISKGNNSTFKSSEKKISKGKGYKRLFEKPYAKLTFFSDEPKELQKYIEDLVGKCKVKGYHLKGPVSLPKTKLRIQKRKAPNGNGSGTLFGVTKTITKKVLFIYDQNMFMLLMDFLKDSSKFEMELKLINS